MCVRVYICVMSVWLRVFFADRSFRLVVSAKKLLRQNFSQQKTLVNLILMHGYKDIYLPIK